VFTKLGKYTYFFAEDFSLPYDLNYGFIGKSSDFKNEKLQNELNSFLPMLKRDCLILPNQVHGSNVESINLANFNTEKNLHFIPDSDALFLAASQLVSKSVVLGIRTADCLPIIIHDGLNLALIHSGWRGLANNLLFKVLVKFKEQSPAKQCLYAYIGPSASMSNYEVGRDVLEKIENGCNFPAIYQVREGSLFVDLQNTAKKIIELGCKKLGLLSEVKNSMLCTIDSLHCDDALNWHSYRRDKISRGSNLLFVTKRD
jgi:copper oxidase (laccase) domain-containing protein